MGHTTNPTTGALTFNNTPSTVSDLQALSDRAEHLGTDWVATVAALEVVDSPREGELRRVRADGSYWAYDGTGWVPINVSHTAARRRVVTMTHNFTATGYTDFAAGADRDALAMTFVKRSPTSKLIVQMGVQYESPGTPGFPQYFGISIGGTQTDVCVAYPQTAGVRLTPSGAVEVDGVAAGSVTIKPQVKTSNTGASANFVAAGVDHLSYSVTESD